MHPNGLEIERLKRIVEFTKKEPLPKRDWCMWEYRQ